MCVVALLANAILLGVSGDLRPDTYIINVVAILASLKNVGRGILKVNGAQTAHSFLRHENDLPWSVLKDS